jgi:long-chain acyl-CoA synthetase
MEIKRLFDCIYHQLDQYPQEKAFGHRHKGEWKYYSTQEMVEKINLASQGLLKLGVKKGDRVALITYENRPEWVIMDIAMQQLGIIDVPVYPTISPAEYEYIFNEAEVQYCFCGKDDLVDKVRKAQANIPTLKDIYAFDHRDDDTPFWEEIFTSGREKEVEAAKAAVRYEDLATIIYTSGTTGNPKGVMLTHENIISNVFSVSKIMPVQPGDRVLSFLPLCHIFERTASYYYAYEGVSVSFAGTDNLGGDEGDLKAVQPHFFTTVPRLLEKVYEKIYNKGLTLSGVKRSLFFWALSLTNDYEYDKKYSGMAAIRRSIADRLIFSKWREALGGNIKGIVSGAAACPEMIAKVFSAAGIPIREAYGLTEASPGITFNSFDPQGAMLGTVGPALSGVEIRIDSDGDYREGEGEILAAGDNIMMGYYKKPEETAKVLDKIDGKTWLRTGDVGKILEGPGGKKYLKITDRKKELLKTSGGKYVAPAPIENKFKEDFMIEQMMVVGEKKKFVSALIVPATEALKDWCKNNEVEWTNRGEVIQHPKVQARYQKILDQLNPNFSHIEQIKKFTLLDTDWEPTKSDGSDAELTPTMKLKRRVINSKHEDAIKKMYEEA